jgi:hypothetical protein
VIIGLQKTPVKLMPVELQDDRHELVEEGEVVRHKEEDGVGGLEWQAPVVARTCLVQVILFILGISCTLLHDLEDLVDVHLVARPCCPRRSALHAPSGGTMTGRTSTLMPWTNSINGIHTDDMLIYLTKRVSHSVQTAVNSHAGSWVKFQVQSVSSSTNLISVYISVCFIPGCFSGHLLSLSAAWTDTSCPYQPQLGLLQPETVSP